jgi:GNAT superfamily N-acetyltransferase
MVASCTTCCAASPATPRDHRTLTIELAIRPFAIGDLPRLQQIRAAAFRPVFQSFRDIVGETIAAQGLAATDEEQAALLDRLCRSEPDQFVFVAQIAAKIAGFVAISLNRATRIGEIGLNAVDPAHARQGVGTRLYAFALSLMRDEGMRLATVSTGGDASHAPARRAYEKLGFGVGIPSVTLYKLL